MKKIYALLIMVFVVSISFGQILKPVKFNYTVVKKGANKYEIHVKAMIEPKWHMYSLNNPEGGAEKTVLSFKGVSKVGKTKEVGKMKTVFEESFKVNQKYFENGVDFVQLVTTRPGTKKVSGSIEYMVCNDSKCLPPTEVPFEVSL